VAVAGPGLPGAEPEAVAVAGLHRGGRVLAGREATAANVAAALGAAGVVHLAVHGVLRADQPQFSALELGDGPLTVLDVERAGTSPALVVLAACDAGRPAAVLGEEVLGLAAALLGLGSGAVVAPIVAIPDGATVAMMTALHRALAAGQPPAAALADARTAVGVSGPAGRAVADAFVCLGDGLR
jgi:CHAT domain-containing protein